MVETLLNTHTSATSPSDNATRPHASAPAGGASAPAPSSPLSTVPAPALTASTVAPDILLAAQQTRDTARPRAFDARAAYGGPSNSSQGTETQRVSDDEGDLGGASDGGSSGGAEIIPLYGNSAFSSLPSGVNAETDAGQSPAGGAHQAANRAYLDAGAADGRAFATTAPNASVLGGAQSPIDLII